MISSVVVAAAVLAGAASGQEGEVQAWVAEALSWGASQKRIDLPTAKGTHSVRYSTPYLRVAIAAKGATGQGRALDSASVPVEVTASELHVFAQMLPMASSGRLVGMAAATGITLVIAGERLKPSSVNALAQPMSAGVPGGEMQKFEGRELRAVFPLSRDIPGEADVIVEYSWLDKDNPKRVERTYRLDLKKSKW